MKQSNPQKLPPQLSLSRWSPSALTAPSIPTRQRMLCLPPARSPSGGHKDRSGRPPGSQEPKLPNLPLCLTCCGSHAVCRLRPLCGRTTAALTSAIEETRCFSVQEPISQPQALYIGSFLPLPRSTHSHVKRGSSHSSTGRAHMRPSTGVRRPAPGNPGSCLKPSTAAARVTKQGTP